MNYFIIIFVILIFLAGVYVYSTQSLDTLIKPNIIEPSSKEGLQNSDEKTASCPNVLIKRGNSIYMYNNMDNHDEMPVKFDSLEDYIQYVEKQRSLGYDCPVLFLQQENDTQGKDVYRLRPSPLNQQGGLQPITVAPIIDASRQNGNWNANNYAGFDPIGLQVGVYNKLDQIHDSTAQSPLSDNPYDFNWGGVEYTRMAIDSGKYAENNITTPNYFSPKGEFIPGLYGNAPPPSYTDMTLTNNNVIGGAPQINTN